MAEDKNSVAAVYVAWTTFRNALDSLAQGLPNVVDRSAFQGQSWGVQSQLIAGLKFLGLITDEGKPTPALQALAVPDEAARKKKLEAIIRERYADLFALDLMKTTPAQLSEQMAKSYNVTGETREKATRFFLAAVDYLDISISRLFKRAGAGNGPTPVRRRRSPSRNRAILEPEAQIPTPAPTSSGTARTVNLKSGGTLTVSASIDAFRLSREDRGFVFELIDKLEEYERSGEVPLEEKP